MKPKSILFMEREWLQALMSCLVPALNGDDTYFGSNPRDIKNRILWQRNKVAELERKLL